jgi:release factor glutamine methyltransferase
VARLLERGRRRLRPAVGSGLPDAAREARWLLAAAWGCSEVRLVTEPAAEVPQEVAARFEAWIERRRRGAPAHHLKGVCAFAGREFAVDERALIPRPETEWLVHEALAAPVADGAAAVDVGVGSGCIAVTLACERPGWQVWAVDRSLAALALAERNSRRHGAAVGLVAGDLIAPLRGPFALVTANLPYVPTATLARLSPEVRHEPAEALDGGTDGLDVIRRLLGQLLGRLTNGAVVLLEVGEDQAGAVEREARRVGLRPWRRATDLGGVDRVVGLRWRA